MSGYEICQRPRRWPIVLTILKGKFDGTNLFEKVLMMTSLKLWEAGGEMFFFAYEGIPSSEGIRLVKENKGNIITTGGVNVTGKRLTSTFQIAFYVGQIAKILKPDLIVGQYSKPSNAAVIIGKLLNIPTIRVVHACPEAVRGDYLKLLRNECLKRIHGVFGSLATKTKAVSKAVAKYEMSCGVPKDKIRVIYNSISPSIVNIVKGRREVREKLGIRLDQPTLLIAASLTPVKGHFYLLRAMKMLGHTCPHLLIAGNGTLRDDLEKFVKDWDVENKVHFLGQRTDVGDLINASDAAILPSISEAFPMFLMEAMAAGIPVIATNVGGIPELVEDGVTGLLVPPRDIMALATGISDFVNNREKWTRMGIASKERISRLFNLENKVEEEITFYQQVASKKRTK